MKSAELQMPYYKQGSDMYGHIEDLSLAGRPDLSVEDVMMVLEHYEARLRGGVELLQQIQQLLDKHRNQPEPNMHIDADTHLITISGPEAIIDQLLKAELLQPEPACEEDIEHALDDCEPIAENLGTCQDCGGKGTTMVQGDLYCPDCAKGAMKLFDKVVDKLKLKKLRYSVFVSYPATGPICEAEQQDVDGLLGYCCGANITLTYDNVENLTKARPGDFIELDEEKALIVVQAETFNKEEQ